MGSTSTTKNRNDALDGLRAVAVGAVFLYHLFPTFVPGGYLGVDVFFVLSGFLITSLLIRERALAGRVSLRNFWLRRARRILPTAVTVMVATCAVTLLLSPDLRVGMWKQVLGILTFATNWVQIATQHSYFDAQVPQIFVHYWSLAVEEQFYLFWPLILLGLWSLLRGIGTRHTAGTDLSRARCRQSRIAAVIVAGLAVGSAALMSGGYQPGTDPSALYYGTHTHAFGLLLGAATALLLTSWYPSRLAARWNPDQLPWGANFSWNILTAISGAVLAVAFFSLKDTGAPAYHWGIFGVCLATAVIIASGAVGRGVLTPVLRHPALIWIGHRSYSIYLWHWPVFIALRDLLDSASARQVGIVPVLAIALTLVLSALSFTFIEVPFQRRGYRGVLRLAQRSFQSAVDKPALTARTAPSGTQRWRSVLRPAGVGIAGTAFALCAALTAVALATAPQQTTVQMQLEQAKIISSQQASAAPQTPLPPAPLPKGDEISVIGDSVALGSTDAFVRAFPGMSPQQVDAEVSRSYLVVPDIINRLKTSGILRKVVILALGANGPEGREYVDAALDAIGPDHLVVVVNAYSPLPVNDAINVGIADSVASHPNAELADWYSVISPRPELLTADQTHPANEEGRDLYAGTAKKALQRLVNRQPR